MPSKMTDIVVVDDNQVLLSVISEIFKGCGYTVRTATDGFAALAQIRRRIPHVLLSDLNMPGMSGFELLSIVRRRFPEIVVIAMSGAYPGLIVLPGVAADAFYAKGASSVAQLFEMVRALGDQHEVFIARTATPVWVQGIPIDGEDASTVLVACPECLRAFSHTLPTANIFQDERSCPHCREGVQLAVIRQSRELDRGPYTSPEETKQGSDSAARAGPVAVEPTERIYSP